MEKPKTERLPFWADGIVTDLKARGVLIELAKIIIDLSKVPPQSDLVIEIPIPEGNPYAIPDEFLRGKKACP